MPADPTFDKAELLELLRARVAEDLARATAAQRETMRGATHEEAKPENDKDTRALEATYLARGLAERVVTLETAVAALAIAKPRVFSADSPAALLALVTLEAGTNGARNHYFIVPGGGGLRLELAGTIISTVTPEAPIGRALIGAYEGDEVSVQTPQGPRAMTVEKIS